MNRRKLLKTAGLAAATAVSAPAIAQSIPTLRWRRFAAATYDNYMIRRIRG